MYVRDRLITALVFVVGGLCQAHSSLYCQRLAPSAANSALSPCRFTCMLRFLETPFNIVIQFERDGTPCMFQIFDDIGGIHQCMGRCYGGACLDMRNYHGLELLQWGPSFRTRPYDNINVASSIDHGSSTAVVTGGGSARTGFLRKPNDIWNADQVTRNSGEAVDSIVPGPLRALTGMLRVKRSPGWASRAGSQVRDRLKWRNNSRRKSTEEVQLLSYRKLGSGEATGSRRGAGYGGNSRTFGTFSGPVIYVDRRDKKRRRGGSTGKYLLGGAALGAAAGVGAAAAHRLSEPNDKSHPSHGAGEDNGAKNSDRNSTVSGNSSGTPSNAADVKGKTEGTESSATSTLEGATSDGKTTSEATEGSATAESGGTGTAVSKSTDGAENNGTRNSGVAEAGQATGSTGSTSSSKSDSTKEAGGAGTGVTGNTGRA